MVYLRNTYHVKSLHSTAQALWGQRLGGQSPRPQHQHSTVVPVCVPAAPLPTQLLASGLGERQRTDPGPATHMEHLKEVLGSSLARHWLLWPPGERTSAWKIFPSPLSVTLSDKYRLKKILTAYHIFENSLRIELLCVFIKQKMSASKAHVNYLDM